MFETSFLNLGIAVGNGAISISCGNRFSIQHHGTSTRLLVPAGNVGPIVVERNGDPLGCYSGSNSQTRTSQAGRAGLAEAGSLKSSFASIIGPKSLTLSSRRPCAAGALFVGIK